VRIAIDTGGTFTDVILELNDGRRVTHKLPSTPDDPDRAVLEGIAVVLDDAGVEYPDDVLHGTTVGTNALLERDGARTLFVTTHGFEDILELRRQNRPELYSLHVEVPPGSVHVEVTDNALNALAADVASRLESAENAAEDRDRAIAVCLLHAYANEEHERRVAEHLASRWPDVFVCRSSEVHNEFREYERAATTTANAFIGPRVSRYVAHLEDSLQKTADSSGVSPPRLRIMQSNGGLISASEAAAHPIQASSAS